MYMKFEKLKNYKCIFAVSGGADSMCMLHKGMLINKKNIIVVHVNHMLRKGEAQRDESFVEKYCKDNEIKYYCEKVDVNSYANEFKISTEEAARILRYKILRDIKEKYGAKFIFLAHNKNDDVETFIHNL